VGVADEGMNLSIMLDGMPDAGAQDLADLLMPGSEPVGNRGGIVASTWPNNPYDRQ